MRRAHVFLVLLSSACPRPAVPPPAKVLEARAVDPCAADFSGSWVHATDPTWLYEARDDGGTVELLVTRRFDAGYAPDAGAAAIVQLRRGDGGFWGEVRALGGLPSGQTCPMSFPVRVTQCTDGGLTLLAAADGVVGEGCLTPARPRNPAMLEHQLTRADAGGMRFSR